MVDTHQCQYTEPFSKQPVFNSLKTHPELGNIDLTIKVAEEPLEKMNLELKYYQILHFKKLHYAVLKEKKCQIIFLVK